MELEEKTSQHFNCPFVYSNKHKLYVCQNGVAFSRKEYMDHKDDPQWLEDEYKIRSQKNSKIDYESMKKDEELVYINPFVKADFNIVPSTPVKARKDPRTVTLICAALGIVSIVSMYISTVHTATYLFDYVDVVSAWLMSAVITIYASTAFEVIILFHERSRHILSVIFAILWTLVITFSMITTVSVFYDRFNFTTLEHANDNKAEDSARFELQVIEEDITSLTKSVADLEESISIMRQEGYVTRAQEASDKELKPLTEELTALRARRREIMRETPNATKQADEVHRKETLFAFLGRIMGIEGGILEFIMSTLSAIFVNLISPLSLTVVVSLKGGKENENNY